MLTSVAMGVKLGPCRGPRENHLECASGFASVHRITLNGETYDACAVHSPYDVTDARPAGSHVSDEPQPFFVMVGSYFHDLVISVETVYAHSVRAAISTINAELITGQCVKDAVALSAARV